MKDLLVGELNLMEVSPLQGHQGKISRVHHLHCLNQPSLPLYQHTVRSSNSDLLHKNLPQMKYFFEVVQVNFEKPTKDPHQ